MVSSLPCSSGDREEGQWFAQGQMQPEEVVGEAWLPLAWFPWPLRGIGCRSGWEKQVLHRHVPSPCCHPKRAPQPLNLPPLHLPQEVARLLQGALRVPAPSKLQRAQSGSHRPPRGQIALGSQPLGDPTEPGQPPQRPQKTPGPQSRPFRKCLSKPGQVPVLGRHSIAVPHRAPLLLGAHYQSVPRGGSERGPGLK